MALILSLLWKVLVRRTVHLSEILFYSFIIFFLVSNAAAAATIPIPEISIKLANSANPTEISNAIQILLLITVLALAPSFIIMTTSFTRIIIVLALLRQALGTQQMPPNQILVGVALFATLFIMMPVIKNINTNAFIPYTEHKINLTEGLKRAAVPLKKFMLRQTREKDIALFVRAAKMKRPNNPAALPLDIIVPSFIISELKTGFEIGFIIYLPFLIIDIVVASILMSMGMLMLPPVMISLPFKLLLFVLADGWNLIMGSLLYSFH